MDPLTRLQLDVESLLKAEAYFADVPILSQARGVTEADIEERLGKRGLAENASGKTGCCLVVWMPIVDVPTPEVNGPRLEVVIPLAVYERPTFNRDEASGIGLHAEEIALEALATLHGRKVAAGITQLYGDERAIDPLPLDDEKTVAYMVYLNCKMTLARRVRVATPSITGNAGAVSFFCNTNGAAIYYTLDGSYPAPTEINPDSTLFGYALETEDGIVIVTEDGNPLNVANPITVPEGTTVRAAAFKPETHLGSDEATQDF